VADEPTGNLDSRTSVEIMALFQELGRSGITLLLVTHEADIARYASRVVVMHDGRVRSDERQIRCRPNSIQPSQRLHHESIASAAGRGARALAQQDALVLTTLGVIIGVSAVIAMVAIGEGAKARVEEAFASMGSNLLVVLSGSTSASGAHGGFGSMPTLTWDDLKAIRSEASAVRYASPQLRSNQQSSVKTKTGRPRSMASRPSIS